MQQSDRAARDLRPVRCRFRLAGPKTQRQGARHPILRLRSPCRPSASITPQEARSDPIGDLVAATVADTPEPDSARESAAAPQPSEPVPDQEPNRPAQAASSSQDVDGAAAGNSAGPPALAFGAEPATSRKHATGGERPQLRPSPLYANRTRRRPSRPETPDADVVSGNSASRPSAKRARATKRNPAEVNRAKKEAERSAKREAERAAKREAERAAKREAERAAKREAEREAKAARKKAKVVPRAATDGRGPRTPKTRQGAVLLQIRNPAQLPSLPAPVAPTNPTPRAINLDRHASSCPHFRPYRGSVVSSFKLLGEGQTAECCKREAERRVAYVHFVRISELVASETILTSMLKLMRWRSSDRLPWCP